MGDSLPKLHRYNDKLFTTMFNEYRFISSPVILYDPLTTGLQKQKLASKYHSDITGNNNTCNGVKELLQVSM